MPELNVGDYKFETDVSRTARRHAALEVHRRKLLEDLEEFRSERSATVKSLATGGLTLILVTAALWALIPANSAPGIGIGIACGVALPLARTGFLVYRIRVQTRRVQRWNQLVDEITSVTEPSDDE